MFANANTIDQDLIYLIGSVTIIISRTAMKHSYQIKYIGQIRTKLYFLNILN